jgi:hypothetical protein
MSSPQSLLTELEKEVDRIPSPVTGRREPESLRSDLSLMAMCAIRPTKTAHFSQCQDGVLTGQDVTVGDPFAGLEQAPTRSPCPARLAADRDFPLAEGIIGARLPCIADDGWTSCRNRCGRTLFVKPAP